VTRTPLSRSKGQRSTCRGGDILWRPPAQLVIFVLDHEQEWLYSRIRLLCTDALAPDRHDAYLLATLHDLSISWCGLSISAIDWHFIWHLPPALGVHRAAAAVDRKWIDQQVASTSRLCDCCVVIENYRPAALTLVNTRTIRRPQTSANARLIPQISYNWTHYLFIYLLRTRQHEKTYNYCSKIREK